MNLTAKEQYELVKDHPEVWGEHFEHDGERWFAGNGHTRLECSTRAAELGLLALFMLAAECGVGKNMHNGGYFAFEYGYEGGTYDGQNPLAAAVAAYERRSGT